MTSLQQRQACPHCGTALERDGSTAGTEVPLLACPTCLTWFTEEELRGRAAAGGKLDEEDTLHG